MAENIWVSRVWMDPYLTTSFLADLKPETKERYLHASTLHQHGRWVPPEDFPDSFYGEYYDRSEKPPPDLSRVNEFLVVTARCAEVMGKFDLGKGSFVPIKLFQYDRVRRVDGEYFIFNFEAQKDTF